LDSTVADDKVEPGSVVEDGERVDGVQPAVEAWEKPWQLPVFGIQQNLHCVHD